VYAAREGVLEDKIRILARNTPPALQCAKCGVDATIICVECYELFCGGCLVAHECGEEMALPVANSPRMGVCGYAGQDGFDDFSLE
jgi:hypothetical protein